VVQVQRFQLIPSECPVGTNCVRDPEPWVRCSKVSPGLKHLSAGESAL